jgi:glycerol-1-phosphate dehydrogenase [NAD(P)+]
MKRSRDLKREKCLLVTNLGDTDASKGAYLQVKEKFICDKEIRPESTRPEYLEDLAKKHGDCGLVVGAGGGVAVDVAKYIGAKNGIEVTAFPTILSTDAMYTSSTATRQEGTVIYVPTKKPDKVTLDFDLILKAPYRLNVAGWGDVLSIHTAVWDWKLAAEKTGETYDSETAQKALRLLDKVRRVDNKEGLMALDQCLKSEVELCDAIGSARPEEGSEHLLVYLIENYLSKPYPHGELVALGIYELSKVQGNRPQFITELMDKICLKYKPEDLGIDESIVKKAMEELPEYSKRHRFPYTVVNETARTGGRF